MYVSFVTSPKIHILLLNIAVYHNNVKNDVNFFKMGDINAQYFKDTYSRAGTVKYARKRIQCEFEERIECCGASWCQTVTLGTDLSIPDKF